jgi:hypothetical protein
MRKALSTNDLIAVVREEIAAWLCNILFFGFFLYLLPVFIFTEGAHKWIFLGLYLMHVVAYKINISMYAQHKSVSKVDSGPFVSQVNHWGLLVMIYCGISLAAHAVILYTLTEQKEIMNDFCLAFLGYWIGAILLRVIHTLKGLYLKMIFE